MKPTKKILCLALGLVCALGLSVSAFAAEATGGAVVSPQTLTVNGETKEAEKYNIGDENYFKLRDLAALLEGTDAAFDVGFDGESRTAIITTGAPYTPLETDLNTGADNSASCRPSTWKLTVDGKEAEVTAYNLGGSNFFRLRDIGPLVGFDVEYLADSNTAAVTTRTSAIKHICAIGFVDSDGAKVQAIVAEYEQEILADSVSADDFEIIDYALSQKNFETGAALSADNAGKPVKVYVNDMPLFQQEPVESGRFVVIEVDTDYTLSSVPSYEAGMSAGVKQVGDIESKDGVISPTVGFVRNYTTSTVESRTPTGDIRINTVYSTDPNGYVIMGIEDYELHYKADDPRYNPNYPAFLAKDCFEEATGEKIDVELPYSLYVPDDYDESQKYALVLMIEDAGALGDDPMIVLTEAQGPYNYATDEVQQLARDQGLGGIIVVAPQVSEELRSTRDNYTISAAVPAAWQLLDYITENYSIDMDRIYGSGQSMGGMQVMAMAAQRDNYFAGQWYLGMQWGNNYNKEEPYPERGGGSKTYFASDDATIWREDADGNDSDMGQNVYYLISDDNILLTNCAGDAFSTGVWKELKFLYQDIAGVELPYTDFNPLDLTVDEQNAKLEELLAQDGGRINFHWQAFNGGSHMLTWVYGHKLSSGYAWLLSQTRTSEMERAKLEELNQPWAAETDAAVLAEKQTPERAIGDDAYYAIPAEGAGTKGYNSAWFGMQGTLTDDVHGPGWTAGA